MKHSQPDSLELRLATEAGARSSRPPRRQPSLVLTEISSLLDVLRRRRALIAATALILSALALGYSLLTPPSYVSSASIMVDPRGLQVVEKDVRPQGGDQPINSAVVDTQMSILTSDPVLAEVADRLDLVKLAEYDPTRSSPLKAVISTLRSLFGEPSTASADVLVLDKLRTRVRVVRVPGSYVLQLYAQARDPDLAQAIADTMATVYLSRETETRREVAQRSVESLASRLHGLRDSVEAAEDAVERYKVEQGIVAASGQLITDQQLSAVNQQLVEARARADELKSRYQLVDALARSGILPESLPESVQSSTIGQLRGQYAQAKQVEADLRAKLGPRHPDLVSATERAEQVRQAIDDELRRIAESVRSEHERAEANVEALQRQIAVSTAEANEINEERIQLRQLEREAEATRAVFESFLGRSREISEQRDVETSNSRIISPASMPLNPQGPSTSIILAGALAFGLALGGGLALLRDVTDGRVHSANQLLDRTGLSVIGAISASRPQRLDGHRSGAIDSALPVDNPPRLEPMDRRSRATLTALTDLLEETSRLSPGGQATMVVAIGDEEAATILAEFMCRFEAARGRSLLLANRVNQDRFVRGAHQATSDLEERSRSVATNGLCTADAPVTAQSPKSTAEHADRLLLVASPFVEDVDIRALASAASGLVVAVRLHHTRFQDIEHARAMLGPLVEKVVGAVLIDGGGRA